MPRQHPGLPEKSLGPFVEHRVEQQKAKRIRGGCCICPGGGLWIFSCSGKSGYDDEAEEAQKLPPMQQTSQLEASPRPSSSTNSTVALSGRPEDQSRRPGQPGLPMRQPVKSLPLQAHQAEPQPASGSKQGMRTTAQTLPPQARPPNLPAPQRRGVRNPSRSVPNKPPGF